MASVSEITSASDMQMDYMKLLVTQLQYQNPLEPMSNEEMSSQLAQFSQLQQLENMNTSFSDVLSATNRTYANSLIGKTVSFKDGDEDDSAISSGVVDQVLNGEDGDITLLAGDRLVALDDIISVKN